MIRTLGKTAFYKEQEYELVKIKTGLFAIISNEPKSLDLGFEKVKHSDDRFIKDVNIEDLDFTFKKESTVLYKGDEFICSIIEGNQVMLYTRDISLGRKHQMIMRDRDEFYLYVDLNAVDEIVQRWIPYK